MGMAPDQLPVIVDPRGENDGDSPWPCVVVPVDELGAEFSDPEADANDTTGGPGAGQDVNVSVQMSGNCTLSYRPGIPTVSSAEGCAFPSLLTLT